jgi:MYXO-CTERM domain-containing protein
MAVRQIPVRGWVGLVAALALAPAAGALDITGLAITTVGANSANSIQNTGNTFNQVASSTSIVIAPSGPVADSIGSSLAFQTRYAWLVAADRDAGGGTHTQSATAEYQITFTVDNPAGHTYRIDIDTLRVGALTNVTDDAGDSTITLGAVTGSVDAVVNGALALATVGPFTSDSTGTSTFSQSGTTLSITDSALSRTFTLNFTWNGTAFSNKDEAAIRMGIGGGITGATADDYPGQGSRTLANDGHFVTVNTQIISTPEPTPAALIALGLVGLALRARRQIR